MKKPVIRIISNLPRSGGTLLGRCVGCMDNITLLSEIHPLGSKFYNLLNQASAWHGLISREEREAHYRFIDAVQLVFERAAQKSSCLVIRDWAHLDYISSAFVANPPYRSLLVESLSNRFDIRQIFLVRHPADIWASLARLPSSQGITLETYLHGFHLYARQCVAGESLKYEEFTRKPEHCMRELCHVLGLPFDRYFIDKWQAYDKITGAVFGKARGSHLKRITPLPHHKIPEQLHMQLEANEDYQASIDLLGY